MCWRWCKREKEKKLLSKFTDEDIYKIAKFAKDHGPNQVARCFQRKYPTIRKKYIEQVRIEKTLNQPPAECITNLTRGRPLMVDLVIDGKVRKFLMTLKKY